MSAGINRAETRKRKIETENKRKIVFNEMKGIIKTEAIKI